MKPIVFLDFDGVVMTLGSYQRWRSSQIIGRRDLGRDYWAYLVVLGHLDRACVEHVEVRL